MHAHLPCRCLLLHPHPHPHPHPHRRPCNTLAPPLFASCVPALDCSCARVLQAGGASSRLHALSTLVCDGAGASPARLCVHALAPQQQAETSLPGVTLAYPPATPHVFPTPRRWARDISAPPTTAHALLRRPWSRLATQPALRHVAAGALGDSIKAEMGRGQQRGADG